MDRGWIELYDISRFELALFGRTPSHTRSVSLAEFAALIGPVVWGSRNITVFVDDDQR